MKATSQTPKSTINEVEITRQEAETLRVPTRKRASTRIVVQQVQVVDINTSDPMELTVVITDVSSGDQHKFKFKDNLLAGLDRHKLFDSLENRKPIWAELALREIDGEVRQVQLLRTRDNKELDALSGMASGDIQTVHEERGYFRPYRPTETEEGD